MPRKGLENFVELGQFELDPRSIRLLPLGFCVRNGVAVLGRVDLAASGPIDVGMTNSEDQSVLELLGNRWGRSIRVAPLTAFDIDRVLDVGYSRPARAGEEGEHRLDLRAPLPGPDASPAELLDDALLHALSKLASDLHIESYPSDVDVRLRIDGRLHQVTTQLSPRELPAVVSRVKILAGLDIAEKRHPQDGRFRCVLLDGDHRSTCDCRVSTLPGPSGEDVVIRILDSTDGLLPVTALGMGDRTGTDFLSLLRNPEGLIVVTGPTGSGKTTTLYSALQELSDPSRKILTAEDPIEYWLPKINQKQVSPQVSMAQLLRAFLRQDPDVILVGEIRDEETARAAARAATTGHLVLATMHTNDAVGTIPRLRSLGLSDSLLADSLLAALAQRLVGRNCSSCSKPAFLTAEQEALLGHLGEDLPLQRGTGCEDCRGTGCTGRIGLFELVVVDQALQDRIAAGAPVTELRRRAAASGRRSIVGDALATVRSGRTSIDEVLRVVPYRAIEAARDRSDAT